MFFFFRRFTEHFAKKAHSVTCVDFLPSVIAVNRKAHDGCGNVNFINADVMMVDQPNHRFLTCLYIAYEQYLQYLHSSSE